MSAVDPRPRPEIDDVAILGAGAAGVCMAIRLRQAGIHSFTVYEKSQRVAGTWRDNTYPGAACDVPSHLYCFSFEPNPGWSRKFSGQPEIRAYLEHCVDKYRLAPHLRLGTEIAGARFDDAAGLWRLRSSAGDERAARILVTATGQLNRPRVPALPGLDQFAGQWFHSARWNHDRDLSGRRVAVIGNGASAIQFIPQIAPVTGRLHVFQRSASWIVPRLDREHGRVERWLFEHLPGAMRLYRGSLYWALEARFLALLTGSPVARWVERRATAHMEAHIADPGLRARLTPDYPIGCKRILISDDYYPALARPGVEVVTSPIDRVTRDGIVTADAVVRAVDTIVFATGFETTRFLAPIRIEGRDGRTLEQVWRDGAEAYLGVAVSGFPNLFLLYGPNTNLGHNSIIFMIECQVHYVLRCIEALARRRLSHIDVRDQAMAEYNAALQRDLERTVWGAGCTSWYKTASGKLTNNWSGFTVDYWRRTRRPDLAAFAQHRRGAGST